MSSATPVRLSLSLQRPSELQTAPAEASVASGACLQSKHVVEHQMRTTFPRTARGPSASCYHNVQPRHPPPPPPPRIPPVDRSVRT